MWQEHGSANSQTWPQCRQSVLGLFGLSCVSGRGKNLGRFVHLECVATRWHSLYRLGLDRTCGKDVMPSSLYKTTLWTRRGTQWQAVAQTAAEVGLRPTAR